MIKINLADIVIYMESDSKEFIKEAARIFSSFISKGENSAPMGIIKIDVKKNWDSKPRGAIYCKTCCNISKTGIEIRDTLLGYNAVFTFHSNKGFIVIENYWQAALLPFLIRIYAYYLLKNNACFLHAACALKNGTSYMILGNSGAGKSTISKELIKRGYSILHDDIVCISKVENGYRAFSHPFKPNRICYSERIAAPVDKMFFLYKSGKDILKKIDPSEGIIDLIDSIYLLGEYRFLIKEGFETTCDLLQNSDIFKMRFTYNDRQCLEIFN